MKLEQLETLSQDQLANVIIKTLEEISSSRDQVMGTVYLWQWVPNEQQENCCRCFADGLTVAKHLLIQAVTTKIPKETKD